MHCPKWLKWQRFARHLGLKREQTDGAGRTKWMKNKKWVVVQETLRHFVTQFVGLSFEMTIRPNTRVTEDETRRVSSELGDRFTILEVIEVRIMTIRSKSTSYSSVSSYSGSYQFSPQSWTNEVVAGIFERLAFPEHPQLHLYHLGSHFPHVGPVHRMDSWIPGQPKRTVLQNRWGKSLFVWWTVWICIRVDGDDVLHTYSMQIQDDMMIILLISRPDCLCLCPPGFVCRSVGSQRHSLVETSSTFALALPLRLCHLPRPGQLLGWLLSPWLQVDLFCSLPMVCVILSLIWRRFFCRLSPTQLADHKPWLKSDDLTSFV